ncbi:uncharacterized protein ACB058_016415 [Synchiropus picturatus]
MIPNAVGSKILAGHIKTIWMFSRRCMVWEQKWQVDFIMCCQLKVPNRSPHQSGLYTSIWFSKKYHFCTWDPMKLQDREQESRHALGPDVAQNCPRKVMSGRRNGGGCGEPPFLSAHRCPEAEPLPKHDPAIQPHSKVAANGRSDYLDVCSSRHSEEEEEGSDSDWSEEDLSLHFSPSVILPSDDEDSDPESGFECVDVSMEADVIGQKREGQKMVPKRQIQLKKRETESADPVTSNKQQASLKDGGGEKPDPEMAAKTPRPEMLQRQHSMPASFHPRLTAAGESDGCGGYKGLVAGASQGFMGGKSEARKLQKSISLDETKTKMASCIIKSVLSKKMQGEHAVPPEPPSSQGPRTAPKHCKPPVLPVVTQHSGQERARDGAFGGGDASCSGGKAPVHVVRDMRSLLKNTYSLSFRDKAPQAEPLQKATSFKVIGQEASPPPSYQQAVGVKGQAPVLSSTPRGHLAKITAALRQSLERKEAGKLSQPVAELRGRRGSEPIISRKMNDIHGAQLSELPCKKPEPSKPESQMQAPPLSSGACCEPEKTHPAEPVPALSPAQPVPSALQQIISPCFLPASSLPVFPSMNAHMGKVSYVQTPVSFIPAPLQPSSAAPLFHLLQPEQKQSEPPGAAARSDKAENGRAEPQQGLLQVVAPPTAAPAAFFGGPTLFSGPSPYHMVLEPKSGQCFYVESPPQPQRKMLLDPETGQYIDVLLPAAKPAVLSVMQVPHPLAMFPQPCLPFTLRTAVNYTPGP